MIPHVRQRPRRHHRPDLRQRRLSRARSTEAARPRRIRRAAQGAGGGARRRAAMSASASAPTSRSAASARRRWPARSASRAACGRARSSASIRPARCNVFIGASPHGQGEETTFAQLVASEIGVGVNDVKVDARRHRQHADGLGHLRQPHDRGRRRRADPGDAQGQGEGQASSPRTCSKPPSRTWTTRTASSS